MLAALAVALVVASLVTLRGRSRARAALVRTLGVAAAVLTVAYVAVLTIDMGYYLYSGQRLDAVFMEYVTDLLGQGRHGEVAGSQVGAQTAAELSEVGTWAVRVLSYAALMTAAIVGWRLVFRRGLAGALAARPRATALALPLAVAVGAWGVHPGGPDSVQSAPIASSTYYALAQSPIWIVKMAVETSGKRAVIPPAVQAAMPESRAIPLAREMLAPGARFVSPRYPNDYLCLPTLLTRGGYRTRMVIGQNRDRSHSRLGLFMARNGLEELIDEAAFPRSAPRMGLGVADGALLDRVRTEIDALRGGGRPYFLAALTTGTHHPFAVPTTHPDVAALRAEPDRYVAALRYLDLELERFFTGLRRDGALRDTVVLLLGDHGRHERVGRTDLENEAGHFTVPLAVWLDPSLRAPSIYRPRVVSGVASQLDLTPTILGLAGLAPRLSSFAGRDVSCALAADCLPERAVYLSEVYDNGAGIADGEGFWFYGFASRSLEHADLALRTPPRRWPAGDPAAAARVERILALYVTANALIEHNSLWSWREFGERL